MAATEQFAGARDRTLDTWATGMIFLRRARRYRWSIRALIFLGIALPATLGYVVASKSPNPALLTILTYLGGTLGVLQFVFSIWANVFRWPENLEYSSTSGVANID